MQTLLSWQLLCRLDMVLSAALVARILSSTPLYGNCSLPTSDIYIFSTKLDALTLQLTKAFLKNTQCK